jgi:hypothetical protein
MRQRDAVEIRDVADGLWLWRQRHPAWREGSDWRPEVASFAVASRGARVLVDPLAPPPSARAVWDRIEAFAPDTVVVLKPDHVRDVDLFARRYGARPYGPRVFFRDDVPELELERIARGAELPGGLHALDDGRGENETPLWIPEHRTLVFADGLTAPEGELRVWNTRWYARRALPALREFLELPFERVIVSHGAPVHDRAAFERALSLEPWDEPET